jgi:hypothetical protein
MANVTETFIIESVNQSLVVIFCDNLLAKRLVITSFIEQLWRVLLNILKSYKTAHCIADKHLSGQLHFMLAVSYKL